MGSVGWDSKLDAVVGAQTSKPLEKNLGLRTVGELLSHYPRTFMPRGETSSLAEFVDGEQVTVVARIVSVEQFPYQDRRTHRTAFRTQVRTRLGDGDLWMMFFDTRKHNAEWKLNQLPVGRDVLLSGKIARKSFKGTSRWELTHPDYDTSDVDREQSELQPIYPTSGTLRPWVIENAVRLVLDVVEGLPERIPPALREEHRLLPIETALRWIHRPKDFRQYGAAKKRLRFDEAFVAQVALAQRRHQQRSLVAVSRTGTSAGLFDDFDARLPFELTGGQKAVEAEILADLAAPHPMHRLLQGEVGSGKTIVALRAMLRTIDSGAQAALLAPTEVLAQQHHRSITAMLGELAGGGMLGGAANGTRVALLTGSMPAASRKAALLDAASGEAGIVIGTHALLEEKVQFADLGLVVVDEQHRFGVEQRAALGAKAQEQPHVLVMTATPIPRTVAMTIFGDLETSELAELPAGRSPIQTTVVALAEHPNWVERAWQRAREEVAAGRQVYLVCPRISGDGPAREQEEGIPGSDWEDLEGGDSTTQKRPPLAAVEEVAPMLTAGPLQGLRVARLHGRLPPDQKDAVMRSFAAGEIDVLVATTVIEVGVDVPNATMMIVLDADRFGLSQLHQLRGRVGRGGHPGLCLLLTMAEHGSLARDRLAAIEGTLDGFEIARRDAELRSEGDVLGSNQSGTRRTLRLLRILRDEDIIVAAREAAVSVVERDPELAGFDDLRAAVAVLHDNERTDFLDKT